MKAPILIIAAAFLLSGCHKVAEAIIEKGSTPDNYGQFTKYTIAQGQQYCDRSGYKAVQTEEMKFTVKFDSSAIYQALSPENQYDINKLYGFSDNNSDHHQYSARFGWRWSDGALRLFAYVYNGGQVQSEELAPVTIGEEISCSIKVSGSSYVFRLNDMVRQLPRTATTGKAIGYQLYPYFGGDETAPHEVRIWIRNDK